MAVDVTIADVASGFKRSVINDNFTKLDTALQDSLSRSGGSPNQMEADIDLNSNDLLNVDNANIQTLIVAGVNTVSTTAVPDWKGPWVTSTAYVLNDLISEAGSSYICIVAHTSGIFSTDLTANKWEVFAQQGSAGAGTGDMLAANNLSDVANTPTSRSNLGLGDIATYNLSDNIIFSGLDTFTSRVNLTGVSPSIRFDNTDSGVNLGAWSIEIGDPGTFNLQAITDDFSTAYTVMAIPRNTTGPTNVNFYIQGIEAAKVEAAGTSVVSDQAIMTLEKTRALYSPIGTGGITQVASFSKTIVSGTLSTVTGSGGVSVAYWHFFLEPVGSGKSIPVYTVPTVSTDGFSFSYDDSNNYRIIYGSDTTVFGSLVNSDYTLEGRGYA